MEDEIKRILEINDSPIKSFEGLTLSQNELILVNGLLRKKKYRNVHYINWKENTSLVKENVELKMKINKRLIKNMLRGNDLVIDLTNCEIDDEDFLESLANSLENNKYIGALLLSQHDEHRFEANDSIKRISKYLRRNNEEFRRFPSDYIHCLLTSHCFTNRDEKLESKIKDLGWKVEEELSILTEEETNKDDKPSKYFSLLYKNESTRQMVLAFRGIKLSVKDWLFEETSQLEAAAYDRLSNEVISHSYYAYQHCKVAYEMSRMLNFNLSFTGYSFGAWLAEQSVYFCYKDYETRNVRAVTFDSPGSRDIIQGLASSNRGGDSSKEDLSKFLDIKTFLFSPNFINTSKEHIGRVYRVFEKSLLQSDTVDVWDDFIMNKFISKIPWKRLRNKFEKWYLKVVKADLIVEKVDDRTVKKISPKYLFYLNGLRDMFSDNIGWLLEEFEKDYFQLEEVKEWPKMDFRSKSENFEEFNLAENAIAIQPLTGSVIPESLRTAFSKPIDAILNHGIRLVIKYCFSSLIVVYSMLTEMVTGGLKDYYCLLCFEHDKVLINEEKILEKDGFDLVFQGCYEIKTSNLFEDKLYLLDSTHLDNQIKNFFLDRNRPKNSKLIDQFHYLEKKLIIEKKRDGDYDVFFLRSNEKDVSVDMIREQFKRLYDINEVYERKYTKKITKIYRSPGEGHQLNGMKNPNFVKDNNLIFEKIDAILKNNQYCCIYGKSGYGKTTLAYEYAFYKKEFSDDYFVHSIVSGENIETNLNELANRFLDTKSQEEIKKTKHEELIKIIRNRIDNFEKKVLFIFDNLITYESIELILSNLNEHKFIITTQNHEFVERHDTRGEKSVELNGFNEDWCIRYLRANKIYAEDEHRKWIEMINRCTEGKMSPQSLFNLINYRKERRICNFEDLEKILNGDLFKKYEIIKEKKKFSFYMLQHLAYLDGSRIDYRIIREIFAHNERDFENSLSYLVKYGYLKEEQIKIEKIIFKMHESIQKEIENNMSQSKKEKFILNIVEKLNLMISEEIVTDIKISNWDGNKFERIKELEKHGNKIYKKYKNVEVNKEILIELLNNMLKISSNILINYDKSLEVLKYILKIRIKTLPENSSDIVALYCKIGSVLSDQGKFEEALEACGKCLKIQKEIFPENYPEIASSYDNIGTVLYNQSKYIEALEYYGKCLDIRKQTLPENHPDIAMSYNNIGLILRNQGKHEEALVFFNECLSIQSESLPANHPEIAKTYNNIGGVLSDQGKYEIALECYEKCFIIQRETLPENHPEIAASYNNIGDVLRDQEKYAEALEYYNKCLTIFIETLSPNHINYAFLYCNIGRVLHDLGKYTEALENLGKGLRNFSENSTPNYRYIAFPLNYIGLVQSDQGMYVEALETLEKSLKFRKEILPENHPEIATSYCCIGSVLNNQGKYIEALEFINKSLKFRKETLPESHPDIATSYFCIGNVLKNQGKYTEAMEYYEKCLKIRKESLPDNHPDLKSLFTAIEFVSSKINSHNKTSFCLIA